MSKTPKQIRESLKQHDQYLDGELTKEGRDELKERALRFQIDLNNITEEVAKQPAEYSYFAGTLAVHEAIRAKAALKVRLVEAQLRTEIKDRFPRDGRSGGPTKDQTDAMVQNEPKYQQALVDLRNAEYRCQLLQADVTASAQKAAMLKLLTTLVQREMHMKGYIEDASEK